MSDLNDNDISTIIRLVKELKGIDFSDYAQSSLKRRIFRFFEINNISDINEFQLKMKVEKEFPDFFINEITVNVTEMFRDPAFWCVLRDTVIPELNNREIINIWHAACSSGEEVFSMAILLEEAGMLHKCNITATDLNLNILRIAQNGIYPLKCQELNSKNYTQFGGKEKLEKYYTVEEKNVVFNKDLISNTKFKFHDLTKDGSFGTFDLIICRNVFIYFNFMLQERVVAIFNRSLTKNSFLAIGTKESISWNRSALSFKEVNFELKIFQKN
jgi:chemotaxis protein methyltransferase CheR